MHEDKKLRRPIHVDRGEWYTLQARSAVFDILVVTLESVRGMAAIEAASGSKVWHETVGLIDSALREAHALPCTQPNLARDERSEQ